MLWSWSPFLFQGNSNLWNILKIQGTYALKEYLYIYKSAAAVLRFRDVNYFLKWLYIFMI
jgi:hypothetical protein